MTDRDQSPDAGIGARDFEREAAEYDPGIAARPDRRDERERVRADPRRHHPLGEPEQPVLDAAVEYENDWYTGGYDLVEQPDGTRKRYYWAELPSAPVVVARAEDRLLFVEQYRPTIRETQLELPAGVVESGESFTAAAARELEEETGFSPSTTVLLEEFWVCTGLLRHRRGVVFADGLEPTEQNLDDNEFLTPRSVPVGEALQTVRENPTNDATLEGVLLASEEGLL
ncbi:MAG: NUDIX hydrolase [Haloferacaceae archaeon]